MMNEEMTLNELKVCLCSSGSFVLLTIVSYQINFPFACHSTIINHH